jgi:pyruvate kinase
VKKATKIIATLGPASAPRIADLLTAGADLFRINFSHGDEVQRDLYLSEIRNAEKLADRPVAVCADLCGPKIRVGMIEGGSVYLEAGQEIVILRRAVVGTRRVSTTS